MGPQIYRGAAHRGRSPFGATLRKKTTQVPGRSISNGKHLAIAICDGAHWVVAITPPAEHCHGDVRSSASML
jgi:hypothetical protein